jgi:hypothetical protein
MKTCPATAAKMAKAKKSWVTVAPVRHETGKKRNHRSLSNHTARCGAAGVVGRTQGN